VRLLEGPLEMKPEVLDPWGALRAADMGRVGQALAGAACAAIAARGQLGERRFRTLYRPFSSLLPADPDAVQPRALYDRIMAACPLRIAWR